MSREYHPGDAPILDDSAAKSRSEVSSGRLSEAQTLELILKTKSEDNEQAKNARDTLLQANLGLVVFIARRYQKRLEFDELVQAGVLGLYEAIEKFDSERSQDLGQFASVKINAAMSNAVSMDSGWVDRQYRVFTRLGRVESKLSQELGRTPTAEELWQMCRDSSGSALNTIPKDLVELFCRGDHIPFALDGDKDDSDTGTENVLRSMRFKGKTPEDIVITRVTTEDIALATRQVIQGLLPQEQEFVRLRYYQLNEAGKNLSSDEIAERMGLSNGAFRYLRASTYKKLREIMGADQDLLELLT